MRGDPSEDFRLATFFPALLEPVLDPVFALIGMIFCLNRKPTPSQATRTALPTEAESADASRRRQRGAKALEERLANKGISALAHFTAEQPSIPPNAPGSRDLESGLPQPK